MTDLSVPVAETWWVLTSLYLWKKLLWPTLDQIWDDFKKLYEKWRDFIIKKATSKVKNMDNQEMTNFRVTKEVFWNWSFTDEAICAEYFGWILAASRTTDGRDDSGIYYLDIIKWLSSKQLHLHYALFHSLGKLLQQNPEKQKVNLGQSNEIQSLKVYFSFIELSNLWLNIDLDFEALFRKWLIAEYKSDTEKVKENEHLPYCMFAPTTLGVQLYMISQNLIKQRRLFSKIKTEDFEDIRLPEHFAFTISEFLPKES